MARSPDRTDPPRLLIDARPLPADTETIDRLARLAVDARRSGVLLRLRRPSSELLALIDAMGLAEVLRE